MVIFLRIMALASAEFGRIFASMTLNTHSVWDTNPAFRRTWRIDGE
jgi:hypothetical protein